MIGSVINLSDELQGVKDSILVLDEKVDDLQSNTAKQMEKMEISISKLAESSMNAINKLTDAIVEIRLILAKQYIEKEDLKAVETNLVNKIENNNSSRKADIKTLQTAIITNKKELDDKIIKNKEDTDIKFNVIKNNDSISISQVIKSILALGLSAGFGFLFSKLIGS